MLQQQQQQIRLSFSIKIINWYSNFLKLTKEPFTSQKLSLSLSSLCLVSQNYKHHKTEQLVAHTPATQSKIVLLTSHLENNAPLHAQLTDQSMLQLLCDLLQKPGHEPQMGVTLLSNNTSFFFFNS